MRTLAVVAVTFALAAAPGGALPAGEPAPLLLQTPTLSATAIAFAWAGDLWVVDREGGEARRLTAGPGVERRPLFSPDGTQVAFTGEHDGNVDVYVVAAEGGEPRRLTWHPGADEAVAWTPDGGSLLLRSGRESGTDDEHFYLIPAAGGIPARLPLPSGELASYSPDGKRLAYMPWGRFPPHSWKRYRGGETTAIWIVDLQTLEIEEVPRDNSNDEHPAWHGDAVYFLSDREGAVDLYAYDTRAREVRKALAAAGFDLKSAAAGPGAIVCERFGEILLYDLASGAARTVEVSLRADVPGVRPRWAQAAKLIQGAALSPTGKRALFAARGDVVTVPAEKGAVRNLTRTPGTAERDPAWAPDGQSIAYLSDVAGEYALHVVPQGGLGAAKVITLGDPPSFFYAPVWSPDGKAIALHDKRLQLWIVEVASGRMTLVDTDVYEEPERSFDPAWSPDGRFLAYTRRLPSHLHAVFLHSLAAGASRQVTDGMSDARYPVFDKGGKYLYFTASTDLGLASSWLDLSSVNRPVTRSAYVVVLDKSLPSPLAPESDEEDAAQEKEEKEEKEAKEKADNGNKDEAAPPEVVVDFAGIEQRTLALPVPARNYVGLRPGKAGEILLLEAPQVVDVGGDGPPAVTVQKFVLEKRKVEKLAEGVAEIAVSFDGEKMLLRQGDDWTIAATAAALEPGKGKLDLSGLELRVEPRSEWRQMYREVWRIQRDFLYDPGFHGLDLDATAARYAPFLEGIAHRADLNYLFREMLGNLVLGHVYVSGGDLPEAAKVPGGLLGADYEVHTGRYRLARIYDGESWNPDLRAPLRQPGVNAAVGEYLLEVEGREVRPPASVYSFFENSAEKPVRIKLGPDPEGARAREVTVVPVASEQGLRYRAWVEDNRRLVDRASGGRLAYVHLPDTAAGGWVAFNRYFFAQVGRQGVIVDDRFNHGGFLADFVVDHLRRGVLSGVAARHGRDSVSPGAVIDGPRAMLINRHAGSGGDALPWYFRELGLGPLIGTRTWGGLVGIYDYPPLVDGGFVTAPRAALYGRGGEWEVENRGVAPDIEVEVTPRSVQGGRDPQLEKAIEVLLAELEKSPPQPLRRPAYPRYH